MASLENKDHKGNQVNLDLSEILAPLDQRDWWDPRDPRDLQVTSHSIGSLMGEGRKTGLCGVMRIFETERYPLSLCCVVLAP
mmetsp:Transcript_48747/g.153027  ORF Transcript_48747/g.153027 Transcript_48747/m.153027 type:complete len:82 (+) Transcript_48747:654-899(+)